MDLCGPKMKGGIMMQRIYLDNAATSYPKPKEVARAVADYIDNIGCNVNRGGYAAAYSAAQVVLDTREQLCRLFHFPDPRGVIFTANITVSLNMLLKGLLRPGDHVLVSAMEHNAVMRPLVQLAQQGVSFDRIPANRDGQLPDSSLESCLSSLLRPQTRAVIMAHASNVCGTILPIERVGAFCRAHGLFFIVDCAQTGGVESIDMEAMHIDALAFTGHKGLLGPQGIGGFLAHDALAAQMEPLLSGGTGSFSDLETVPELLPDRFEPGTPNLPGIFGLHAALQYLEQTGMDMIREREQALTQRFIKRLHGDKRIRIVAESAARRVSVVSLDFIGADNAEIAFRLDSEYGVMTRCGLHCAPNAHKVLGTFPQGTVRFSFGHFNSEEQVDYTADAVLNILASEG
ncbi:cysteine desulfurase [Anaerotruncus colihominis]|uniref:cysteine desulfurase n=3 Tax=Anaerotruncus colihominis TaxID=169435 RepID=A0A1Y4E3I5_9FIRM|nr:cysteine desulfurase [Anaerotruncus colihominis]OUP68761.1 cysteine desulfurase [Anaerotruncus colihominis]OUP73480.1 cysteine desulfurase [Anaerotruncus colihominis]RGE68424.1 aminotransferase class V-fold PLP-dependent enzyme [Anaerotruncus colihominis]